MPKVGTDSTANMISPLSPLIVPLDTLPPARTASANPSRPIVRIHILGAMRATTYLGDDFLPRGRKARAILGCLCLASGARVTRNRLAAMLWDRVSEFQARASFRQALRELVVTLGGLADELLLTDRETVRLDTNLCWIDALAVLSPEATADGAERSNLASLCTGELLEELDGVSASFDQWLLGERSRFTEKLRAQLEAELKEVHRGNSDASARAEIARRLVSFDPTHEGGSRILMRALADMGERAQALREYARCCDALKRSLDIEPSPETTALHDAIKMFSGGENARTDQFAPIAKQRKTINGEPVHDRNRLRVGVLPFLSMQSHANENLAFSLSQQIAAALARFRWFDVIAPVSLMRRSSVRFVNDDMLRNELDYVVDGSLSGNGEKYHIDVRLLDLTRYATPVWSARFELGVDALHELDDLVTTRIVAQIDPVILYIEGKPKRRDHYGATGLLLLAVPMIYSMEREKYEEAGRLINRAMEMEPDNAMAHAWAAYWQVFYVGQGWTKDVSQAFTIAQKHALRAIKIDPDNAEALGIYAHICSFLDQDFDTALYYFDRALRLNPSLAFIWAWSAPTYCYIGKPDIALQRLDRYRELAPFDPYYSWFENFYTIAYTFLGDYKKAVVVGRRVVENNPGYSNGYKPLIAALGHLGRRDEAKRHVEKLLELESNFTIRQFSQIYPIKKDSDRERYVQGLRLAGVPEQ